jgi:hypothetical protein
MNITDVIQRVGLVISIGLIAFILGQAVAFFELPSSKFMREAFFAIEAIQMGWEDFGDDHETQQRDTTPRVVTHDLAKMGAGLTLLIETGERTLGTASVNLVTHDGEVRHTWTVPWEDIAAVGWPDTAGGGVPMSRRTVYPRSTHLYPNGDLLLLMHARGRTPFGVSLAKLDINSKLVWTYNRWAHHDISVADDGRIYTMSHELKTEGSPAIDALQTLDYDIMVRTPFIDDTIVVLSPEGEELASLSLVEALASSEFVPLLGVAPLDDQGDHLHANSIQVVTEALADQIPFAKPGNVLISVRTLHALLLVDLEEETVTWVATGQWRYQHDANFLSNGNILFLDNIGDVTHTGGASRVIEYAPTSGEIVWEYHGTDEYPMNSRELGELQKISNGNVLVSETLSGRLVEVTPDKEVVWEYFGREVMDAERIPFERVPAQFSE